MWWMFLQRLVGAGYDEVGVVFAAAGQPDVAEVLVRQELPHIGEVARTWTRKTGAYRFCQRRLQFRIRILGWRQYGQDVFDKKGVIASSLRVERCKWHLAVDIAWIDDRGVRQSIRWKA